MYDIERVIAKRIERSRQYITPQFNPVIARKHEIEIRILQTAPRIEA